MRQLKSKHNKKNTYKPVRNISIVSTTGILKRELIQEIYEYYEDLGCNIHICKSCFIQRRLTIADDKFRASELLREVKDKKCDAIIFARGGEYSERLLPYLDKTLIKQNPKLIIGFSDLTSILSFFVENSKSRVFHGPMATDIIYSSHKTTKILKSILRGKIPDINLPKVAVLYDGEAEGILKGGCISVLANLLDTGFCPSFSQTILFIEDINESKRALRRIFQQFKTARKLMSIQAVIFGEMYNCGRTHKSFWEDFKLTIFEYFFKYQIPIGYNLLSGHGKNEYYLPLGKKVRLSLKHKHSSLKIL